MPLNHWREVAVLNTSWPSTVPYCLAKKAWPLLELFKMVEGLESIFSNSDAVENTDRRDKYLDVYQLSYSNNRERKEREEREGEEKRERERGGRE